MPKTRRNAAALLLGVAVGAALLSGCGSNITPRAVAEPASEKAPEAPKPTTPKRTPTPQGRRAGIHRRSGRLCEPHGIRHGPGDRDCSLRHARRRVQSCGHSRQT